MWCAKAQFLYTIYLSCNYPRREYLDRDYESWQDSEAYKHLIGLIPESRLGLLGKEMVRNWELRSPEQVDQRLLFEEGLGEEVPWCHIKFIIH